MSEHTPERQQGRLDGWTIVFDLDGTLVESAPDLLRALNHCLREFDMAPVELDAIRTMIGRGAAAMIAAALQREGLEVSETKRNALWTEFIAHYEENICIDSHLFEGAEAALDALAAEGARLAVCTNKTQALSDRLLLEIGIAHRFAAIAGADSVSAKKPDGRHILETIERAGGRAERAIMVGDSRTDEGAALDAGLPFLFVPFGYEQDAADQIRHSGLISHYSELLGRVLALAA